jgi:hypothetical protein
MVGNFILKTEMKTTQIYLLAIGLLMYMSYSAHRDEYKQKQQKAQVHQQFCASFTSHPNCSSK